VTQIVLEIPETLKCLEQPLQALVNECSARMAQAQAGRRMDYEICEARITRGDVRDRACGPRRNAIRDGHRRRGGADRRSAAPASRPKLGAIPDSGWRNGSNPNAVSSRSRAQWQDAGPRVCACRCDWRGLVAGCRASHRASTATGHFTRS
jgi:hypothetical protein